jgi:Tfp pilus assembly protein FimT
VVCASNNQKDCTDEEDTWADGWIVFSDVDGDNEPKTIGSCDETEDCIISSRKGLPSGSTLTTTTDKVRFLPTGLADNSGVKTKCGGEETTRTVKFTLKAKNCEKSQAREICINQLGRTSVVRVGCS